MIVRFIIITAIVAFLIYLAFKAIPMKRNQCPRCEGKGYWYNLRNREKCKDCNGTGKLS